ncbi:hypothetical protein HMI54_012341 [Coelomomyces lativittatus]|nr:hypothetical protein HMI54_012341 [Coelomomyces lativittatus]
MDFHESFKPKKKESDESDDDEEEEGEDTPNASATTSISSTQEERAINATLILLAHVIPHVSAPAIRNRFAEIFQTLKRVYDQNLHSKLPSILKNLVGCVAGLLDGTNSKQPKDTAYWNQPQRKPRVLFL